MVRRPVLRIRRPVKPRHGRVLPPPHRPALRGHHGHPLVVVRPATVPALRGRRAGPLHPGRGGGLRADGGGHRARGRRGGGPEGDVRRDLRDSLGGSVGAGDLRRVRGAGRRCCLDVRPGGRRIGWRADHRTLGHELIGAAPVAQSVAAIRRRRDVCERPVAGRAVGRPVGVPRGELAEIDLGRMVREGHREGLMGGGRVGPAGSWGVRRGGGQRGAQREALVHIRDHGDKLPARGEQGRVPGAARLEGGQVGGGKGCFLSGEQARVHLPRDGVAPRYGLRRPSGGTEGGD
mmetsp:Transcript_2524/g.4825  ORF Transcript_2524/g.4825 Transcript_2524/m.4825 type:complete len:291 (+) Transcript_2524:652-1524(+)